MQICQVLIINIRKQNFFCHISFRLEDDDDDDVIRQANNCLNICTNFIINEVMAKIKWT